MGLVSTDYCLDKLKITKPKKSGDFLVSKVKCNDESITLQFPKGKYSSKSETGLQLPYGKSKYATELITFLENFNKSVVSIISENSVAWFGKNLQTSTVEGMNTFNKESINTFFKKNKGLIVTEIIDNKGRTLEYSDIVEELPMECILRLKYLVFSKTQWFFSWEVLSIKIIHKHKKMNEYLFLPDPESDDDSDSEPDQEYLHSFF